MLWSISEHNAPNFMDPTIMRWAVAFKKNFKTIYGASFFAQLGRICVAAIVDHLY